MRNRKNSPNSKRASRLARLIVCVGGLGIAAVAHAAGLPRIQPDWGHLTPLKTQLAMEVCVEPPMLRSKRTHDPLFRTLADFDGQYSRLAFWFPYPRMAVAELEPPTRSRTSWDFRLLDPVVIDFMKAANGRKVMVNFSTIPEWMFQTSDAVRYPSDPDEIDWKYEQPGSLRDPSLGEVRDYFTRVFSWYTQGGFTDENGERHESGHHFKFDVWEVLNEVDFEHHLSPQLYTRIYDAVVGAIRKIDPQVKFSGPALGQPLEHPEFLQYFLDPGNHQTGIPVDFVSYHFYAGPSADEPDAAQPYSLFSQMDGFLGQVRSIELVRQRLAPNTRTFINELGTVSTDNFSPDPRIPSSYWSLSGAAFAYAYLGLARQGIDLIGGAELINYPTQVPGASLTDWNTGKPNARYRSLKLLHDQLTPGDRLAADTDPTLSTTEDPSAIAARYFVAQGFVSPSGERKVVIVNQRSRLLQVEVVGAKGGELYSVDLQGGANAPTRRVLESDVVQLQGFAVAVIRLKQTSH
jgi:hypothetical protein